MKARFVRPRPHNIDLVLDLPLHNFVAGTVIKDEQGSYDGTATNSPTPTFPGFKFTAASSMYIDIGTGPTSSKTIALWINQDDISGNEYPIDLNGTDYLAVESGTLKVYGIAGRTLYVDGAVGASGSSTITAGKWHHIVITDATANNASDMDIGRVTASYFDGKISDVRIYDQVKSATEVKDLYELTRWKYGV